jgi:hypothetical protein
MPSKRTLLGAAAFSVALAGGGVAGAVLGTPSLSSAQDTPTSTAPADGGGAGAGAPAPDGARPPRPPPRAVLRRQAADALVMSPEDLRSELQSGKSIAQVAQEKGVDQQQVIDAIVADATEKLQAEIDRLPDQVTEAVEREGLPERPAHVRPPMGAHRDADRAADPDDAS